MDPFGKFGPISGILGLFGNKPSDEDSKDGILGGCLKIMTAAPIIAIIIISMFVGAITFLFS